jgi:hypothetical protein
MINNTLLLRLENYESCSEPKAIHKAMSRDIVVMVRYDVDLAMVGPCRFSRFMVLLNGIFYR